MFHFDLHLLFVFLRTPRGSVLHAPYISLRPVKYLFNLALLRKAQLPGLQKLQKLQLIFFRFFHLLFQLVLCRLNIHFIFSNKKKTEKFKFLCKFSAIY